jgi:hypothetical protein
MIKTRGDRWTTEEINLVKELYQKGLVVSDISPKVNHSANAVVKKLKDLRLTGSRRILWTEKDLELLKDLFNKGLSYPEMADVMGKSVRACQSKAIQLGLKKKECNVWLTNKRADFWTDSEIETLKKSIADGLLMPDILKLINRSEKCIFNKMHELDLHLRERTAEEKSLYRRAYSVDDDYFETINSQKKAYWLGWLITDGYVLTSLNTKRGMINVNSIGIKLSEKDRYVLEDFKKDVNADVEIKFVKRRETYTYTNKITNEERTIQGGNQAELRFSSAKMIKDLEKYGIHQNKTYDVVFPKELDSKYYPGFIAGVISGDGCIDIKKNRKGSILRCTIAGNFDLVQNIHSILTKEIGVNADKKLFKYEHTAQLYRLELSQTETIDLYNWLQKNGISLMERKNKLIEEFLNERVKIPA